MADLKLRFKLERETKRTKRFAEVADEGEEQVGTIYLQKTTLTAMGDPEEIEVTVKGVK